MTPDQITSFAKQAGLQEWWDSGSEAHEVFMAHLQRFAELVRNAALGEATKQCDEAMEGIWQFHPEYVNEVGRNCCTNLAKRIRGLRT